MMTYRTTSVADTATSSVVSTAASSSTTPFIATHAVAAVATASSEVEADSGEPFTRATNHHHFTTIPSFGFSWPFAQAQTIAHSTLPDAKPHTIGFVRPSPKPKVPYVKVEQKWPTIENDKFINIVKNEKKQYRKARTLFSPLQLEKLENEFQRTKYLSTWDRERLARFLQITDTQVKTWFQNRRKKWKRINGYSVQQAEKGMTGGLPGVNKLYNTAVCKTPTYNPTYAKASYKATTINDKHAGNFAAAGLSGGRGTCTLPTFNNHHLNSTSTTTDDRHHQQQFFFFSN